MTHVVGSNPFQQIPVDVFNTLSSLTVSVTYRSRGDDDYQPGGEVQVTYTEHTVRAILDSPSHTLVAAGVVRASDKVLLVARLELPVVPKPDDRVVIDERTYIVLDPVNTDPAEALWMVPVRG